ncbi:carboxypeptidase-like regulatory domain-containing protein [Psychroserpens sp.]|uniref:carboxypeptidase-like regulatory domain-containing protein n=1 Tax=Psychroserpens sp. TaxID=2020870 RepID=UPI002B264DA3|nr:carboxypeptidase-like regulatory domain-containing protein [Psychroserpens sp.]
MNSIKRLLNPIAFLSVFALVIISCDKDDSPTTPQEQNQDHNAAAFAENFGNDILRTFLGTVVDTNDNPIDNAMISIGNKTAITDSNGVFIIEDAPVNQRFGYVKAEKAGFIHASRAVVPSNGTNKVRIMMLAETIAGSTSSGTQETIALANGASVALEGAYIKADGSSYSGNVNVIMHHLDPADDNMRDQMPGMLYAANAQNEERMLQTFGMLAVELRGSAGEDLNIAEGSTAEIRMPLDASLMSNAPATIPLWYFDEVNGYWIEDGQATLVGSEYVGTVSHFSFWTCSVYQIEHSILTIYIEDENQNPLENIKVSLESGNLGLSSSYTNENGMVSGFIPSNQSIDMNIFSSFNCEGNSIYYESIGPFSTNTTLNITAPNNPNSVTEELAGSFNTCNGNSIENGYVFITHSGKIFTSTIQNGNFNTSILRCTNNDVFKIEAIDYNSFNTTGEIYYAFTSPSTYLGNLSSCNDIDEFVSFKLGDDIAFIPHGDSFWIDYSSSWDELSFNSGGLNDDGFAFSLKIRNASGEDYHPSNETLGGFVVEGINDTYSNGNFYISSVPFELESYVSTYGNLGEYVDVTFSGNYTSPEGTIYPIHGIIHGKRDQ